MGSPGHPHRRIGRTGLRQTMAKNSTSQSVLRQWKILQRLPRHGAGITARELHQYLIDEEGICVEKRTVERDLIELSRHFAIYCNDQSVPYGWRWMGTGLCGHSD